MATISLCMIVKNEKTVLPRCLNSIKNLVDEIIIVDTGSNDCTKEIASNYTPYIYDYEWNNNFADARNYSFSKATKEYIMWLDADDILLEEDRLKFMQLKESLDSRTDAVIMTYNVWVNENNEAISSIKRERLVKTCKGFKWIEPVHEILEVSGNVERSDICITHKPEHESSSRNLKIFEEYMESGKSLSPRGIFNYAEELFAKQRFEDAMKYYNKVLTYSNQTESYYITACQRLSTCYRIQQDIRSSIRELLRSFEYDIPHPYICCQLGDIFKESMDYIKAIFWYELALSVGNEKFDNGLLSDHSLKYLPCIELSGCYKMVKNKKKSDYYKDKALEYIPNRVKITYGN